MQARGPRATISPADSPTFAQDLPLTGAAIAFASDVHRTQRRASDQAPFILHPLEVAALLHHSGASDEVVAAGVLHDVVEKTDAPIEEIRQRFGGHVAALVASVTEDPTIESMRERKSALRGQVHTSGTEAELIFAADKLSKVRELRVRLTKTRGADQPDSPEILAKLEHYRASLGMLEESIPEHPLVRQLRCELEGVQALAADQAALGTPADLVCASWNGG